MGVSQFIRKSLHLMILAAMVITVSGGRLLADQDKLIIANSNWAPYKGEAIKNGGIVTDITVEALKSAGYQVDVKTVPWKRALKGAYKGEYHVIPAIWYTPERADKLSYATSVITSRVVMIYHRDFDFHFNDLDDLTGQTVGVAAGWAYPEAFEQAKNFVRDEANDLKTNLNKILHRRINITIGEEYAARYTASSSFPDKADVFRYSDKALEEKNLYVAFSRKLPNFREITTKFNKAIAEMKADGRYQLILEAHGVSAE